VIARVWTGWAARGADAEAYQRHYESEVAGHLSRVAGFRGARLLRADDGGEVRFTSITYFAAMGDVRGFAGDDPGAAVVAEAARRVLSRWDDRVVHHDVVVAVPGGEVEP
jgi:heme-degrading monooxygenase HmoA